MRLMRSWLVILGAACVVLLGACASKPPLPAPVRGSAMADEAAKRFETRDGVARVYVHRNTRHGLEMPLQLSLDQTTLGTVPAYAYMPLELAPGFHTLVARGESEARLELNLLPGRSYFVQLNFAISNSMGKPELLNMHPLEAQNSIRNECSLVLPNSFRLPG